MKQAFDAAAAGYDGLRRKLIPCFDDFYGAAVDCPRVPGGGRAADPRPGGRNRAARRAAARPLAPGAPHPRRPLGGHAGRARERFAGRGAPAWRSGSPTTSRDPLGGPYDAVVSALSIHHLADAGKRALFRRAFAALRPGGRFVDADNVLAPTPRLAARDRALWIARVRESGIAEAELAAALRRTRLDVLAPLPAQLGWLRRAGFADVDCSYKWLHFAVFGGRRPPGQTRGRRSAAPFAAAAPTVGATPSWRMSPSASHWVQLSTIFPPLNRSMVMPSTVQRPPIGSSPMSSLWWVPVMRQCTVQISPSV